MLSCEEIKACMRLYREKGSVKLSGLHHVCMGKRDGQKVWIVSGDTVVRKLYPEWIMGGNDQRYRFNPQDDIWIDDRIGVEELEYTIRHELLERRLMRERGWSYDRAHNQALALEKLLRDRNQQATSSHVARLSKRISAGENFGKLNQLDQKTLSQLYRMPAGRTGSARIWVVDGPLVRHVLAPNFCFSDNGPSEPWIPDNEIWLDSAMNSAEAYFSTFKQKLRYKLLGEGHSEELVYEYGMVAELLEREKQVTAARRYEQSLPEVQYGARERGARKHTSGKRGAR